MVDIITTGLVGLVSSAITAMIGYLTQKRKVNSEVKQTDVNTMNTQFDFYKRTNDYNNELLDGYLKQIEALKTSKSELELKVDELIKENRTLNDKVDRLQRTLDEVLAGVCNVKNCNKRVALIHNENKINKD
jgi:predicted RNase H-like nuclease (RuvC/YqgF family)